jgi:hypothetical protein
MFWFLCDEESIDVVRYSIKFTHSYQQLSSTDLKREIFTVFLAINWPHTPYFPLLTWDCPRMMLYVYIGKILAID